MTAVDEEKRKSILDKIRKLIAVEQSHAELGELKAAEVYARKVKALMDEYEILEAELAAKPENKNKEEPITSRFFFRTNIDRRHEGKFILYLVSTIAKYNYCHVTQNDERYRIIGKAFNAEIVEFITIQLANRLRQIGREEYSKYRGPEKKNTWLRGFYHGAVRGIEEQLSKQQAETTQSHSNLPAIIRNNNEAIAQYIRQNINLRGGKGPVNRGYSGTDGRTTGVQVGRTIAINKGIGGNSSGQRALN